MGFFNKVEGDILLKVSKRNDESLHSYRHRRRGRLGFYAQTARFGFANWEHTQRMNRLLTAEVLAAVRALESEGFTEIYINDAHGYGYSLSFEEFPESCRIIHGRGGHGPSWTPFLDEKIDIAIAIGQHPMAGTPRGNCNHSLWMLTDGNGEEHMLSETTMFALLAGTVGVPLVMVSGDDLLCKEVATRIGGCATAAVKTSLGLQNACSLSPVASRKLIAEKVHEGVANRAHIHPFVLTGPFRLNVADRDPAKPELKQSLEGADIRELMHAVCNRTYAKFGNNDAVDDCSFRWPPNEEPS